MTGCGPSVFWPLRRRTRSLRKLNSAVAGLNRYTSRPVRPSVAELASHTALRAGTSGGLPSTRTTVENDLSKCSYPATTCTLVIMSVVIMPGLKAKMPTPLSWYSFASANVKLRIQALLEP